MQQELDAEGADVWIVGINGVGYEDTNDRIVEGRDLAWLQDTRAESVWDTWGVAYRDVVVLDADSDLVTVYNLSSNSLTDEKGYEGLKDILATAAN